MPAPLPKVPPHREHGKLYLDEFTWQETECCQVLHDIRRCACSDHCWLVDRTSEFFDLAGIKPPGDDLLRSREALKLIRSDAPDIQTADELFLATAWSPVKVILRPQRHYTFYTKFSLLLWARARAAGEPVPWEARPRRRMAA